MIERMASDRLWIYTAIAGSMPVPGTPVTDTSNLHYGHMASGLTSLCIPFGGGLGLYQDPDVWKKLNPNPMQRLKS